MPRTASSHRPARREPLVRWLVASVVTATVALLFAQAASASAGTLRVLQGSSPSLGRSVAVAIPGGGSFAADPGRVLVRLSQGGTASESTAWCVDRRHTFTEGTDYPVDVTTSPADPELAGPGFQAAGWLMGRADALIAAAADPQREAAAIQIAVWRLTGEAADIHDVTSDAALNARAQQLRDAAHGMAPATALALSGPSAATVGAPLTLTVTGTPGASVTLAVTAGAATLSATSLTVGPGGSATVTVTPGGAGPVTVSASAPGGRLLRAAHLPGARAPQSVAFVLPSTLSASATFAATAPAVAGGAASAPVVVSPATRPATAAALRLGKTAPATVRYGGTILYTLTVSNPGAVAARNVVLRDPVPGGTFVAKLPRRARLDAGDVVWNLGTIPAGGSVTVHLRLRALASTLGRVRNVAAASASNAATVHAAARTKVLAPTKVLPAHIAPVTG